MMKRIREWDWNNIATYILPVLLVGSFFEMYFAIWAFDTFVKIIAVLISLMIFIKGGYRKKNPICVFVLGYIIFCLLTGFSYLWNKRSFSFFFADISDYVLPILFVFVGLCDSNDRVMYDRFFKCLIPVFAVGVFCFLTTPEWYRVRLAEIMNSQWFINKDIYDEESILAATRFNSFFRTSYPVSHFVTFGVCIACFDLLRIDKNKRFLTASILILILVSILCQHRVAIACTGLFLFITLVLGTGYHQFTRMWPLIILIGIGIIGFLIWGLTNERFQDLFMMVSERLEDMSVKNALSERKFVHEVMSSWDNVIFGQGIGSGGAAARAAGYYGITDQNYVKLLYETGVFGCLYLLLIFLSTLIRAIRYYKFYLTEIMIIVFILIAMLGSNSLAIYYTYIILFWYAVGRVWNRTYLRKAAKNKIKIGVERSRLNHRKVDSNKDRI